MRPQNCGQNCGLIVDRIKAVVVKMLYGWHLCSVPGSHMGMYPSCIFLAAFQEEICTPMLSVLRFLSFYCYAFTMGGGKKTKLLHVIWGSSQFPALSAGRMPAPRCSAESGQSTASIRGGGFGAWRSYRKLGVSLMLLTSNRCLWAVL